ncbi:MAG TPA: DHA2 family efflux MFS transporter permease subunit [Candidatus Limnocylindrales bacterium]|nr:DHA2 family efflux MFS transporter permease subunit [Candidatus Limnocylindrales bacterium]
MPTEPDQPAALPIDDDPPLTRTQLLVTAGVMTAIAVAALDSTVVGTAMPTIIGQLGGLGEYSWVFTAYLVTSTTTVPLYARLADIHGRKPVFLIGLALFVLGSVLCGTAHSMLELIVWRAVQGLGAGAVQPISFTIAGDIFTSRQRARMQGVFSGVWGVSAVVGPALGGIITTTVGWPWVFEINLPVGILAAAIIWFAFHERFERHPQSIDWLGAALLTGSVVLLLFAVSEGGQLFGWTSPLVMAMLGGAVALFVAFVWNVRRVPAPLVDLELVRSPLVRAGLGISILAGIVMFGETTYVPPMVQGVHGGSALDAGAAVAAMSLGWPIASVAAGRILLRTGARPIVLAGTAAIAIGALLLTQLARIDALWFAMLACFVTGVGMGLTSTTLLVVIQGAVVWSRRAVATGLVQFSRTIGGAVGVGVMGGVLAAFVGSASSAILDPAARGSVSPAAAEAARSSLAAGLDVTYWIMAVAAAVAFVVAVRTMPDVELGHEIASPPDRARPADAA